MKKFLCQNWQISAVIILAIVLRFLFLGLRPFDGDEGVVIKMAQAASLPELFASVANDVHPPLFHFLEFLSLKIFTASELTARLVSAVAGMLAIWPIYLVFRKLANQKIALAVAGLTVFSAVLGYHAAEARPYVLLTLVFFAQFYYFLRILEEKKFAVYFWFFAFSFALIFTQYIGFVVLAGETLYILLRFGDRPRSGTVPIRSQNLTAAILSVALFAILWGRAFLHQFNGRRLEQDQLVSLKDNIIGIINAVYRFGAGRLFLDLDLSISKNLDFAKSSPLLFIVFILSIIAPIGLMVFGGIVLWRKKKEKFWVIKIVLLPIFLAAILSSEIGPRAARYLSFLAPIFLYLIVVGIFAIKKKYLKFALAGIFLAIFLAAFINGIYFERKKPGVNAIAAYLVQNAKSGDAVVISGGYGGGESWVANYYLGEKANDLRIVDLYGDYRVGNLRGIKSRDPVEQIISAEGQGTTVWLYDLTYSVDQTKLAALNPKKIDLGKDKENKELILYRFSAN